MQQQTNPQDAWGGGLALPTPKTGSTVTTSQSSAATSTSLLTPVDLRQLRPFSEDPTYLTALEQATATLNILPSLLSPEQFSNQHAYPPPPPPPIPSASTTATRSYSSTATPPSARPGKQPPGTSKATPSPPPPPSDPVPIRQSKPKGTGISQQAASSAPSGAASSPAARPGSERSSKQQDATQRAQSLKAQVAASGAPAALLQSWEIGTESPSGVRPGTSPADAPAGKTSRGKSAKHKYGQFEEYLPQSELQRLVKSGAAFTGQLRVNASDRNEAYVTVPGLPQDVLVRNEMQNRAFDGDEVVVQILPVCMWYKVHGKCPQDLKDKLGAHKEYLERGGTEAAKRAVKEVEDKFISTPWVDLGSVEQSKQAICQAAEVAPSQALRVTGRVVGIQQVGRRREQLVGVLQSSPVVGPGGVKPLFLLPMDPTVPRCLVAQSNVPHLSLELVEEAGTPLDGPGAKRTLVSARVVRWDVDQALPTVEIRQSLGQAGEIESETAAILALQGVKDEEFSEKVLSCLPPTPWTMSDQDMASRRDFRNHRIFSIDPATARDLDDALHVQPVPGKPGHWHVGVHIADVAHFIPAYSALDYEAGLRSTSVYLVQRVIPMLPRLLCEELCSLNPGVDRFAFSIEFEVDSAGEVVAEWAGRSIIRSRAKLAYEMVQEMIEGVFSAERCTAQLHSGATWEEVVGDCMALHGLAQARRRRRFEELGALRLDNVKLWFSRDKDGNPVSCGKYKGAEANQLVEEFMLLANMRVAELIATVWPERAMLRCHPPPNPRKITELQALADTYSIPLDCRSAGALQASLTTLRQEYAGDPYQLELLILMATRPMQLAKYFCTGEQLDRDSWRHYALAVPAYTHFTSPIRRYPDVVVHRLLAAALAVEPSRSFADPSYYAAGQPGMLVQPVDGQLDPPQPVAAEKAAHTARLFGTELAGKVAEHANDMRLAARNAQDLSLKLFLCVLLRKQPRVTLGVVSNLGGDKHIGVYLPEYGIDFRLYTEDHGPFLDTYWDGAAKTLVLKLKGCGAGTEGGDSNGSSTGQRSGSMRRGNSNAAAHKLLPKGQQSGYLDWMKEATAPGLTVEHDESPMMLPAQIKMFSRVPVVIWSPLKLGQISQVEGRLLLDCRQLALTPNRPAEDKVVLEQLADKVHAAYHGAPPPVTPAPAPADVVAALEATATALTAEGPPPVTEAPFCIPYDTMLND